MSSPRRIRPSAIVLTLVIGGLAVPSTASAFLRGVSRSNGPTETPLSNQIDLSTASCPSGKQAIAGNAFITSPALTALGGPVLAQAAIDNGGARFIADGRETDAFSNKWRTGVAATCAANSPDRPKAGSAGSNVKGVQVVVGSSASGSSTTRLGTATCPAGKTAIAGGGDVFPSGSGPIVDLALTRSSGGGSLGGSWQVGGREVDPTSASWRVTPVAICANVSTETKTSDYTGPDLQVAETTSLPASSTTVNRTVSCPSGMRVVGGGARAIALLGEPANINVALVSSRPTGNGAGWTAIGQETDATSATWRLVVQAVCTRTDTALSS